MIFFDFHHHHPNQNGILNVMPFKKIPDHFFSVGIHPKLIDENWEHQFKWVQENAENPHCIAIGECGLDAFSSSPAILQSEVFEKQILLANEIKKPLIIHCVKRFSELLKLRKIAKVPMVIHGFNKKKEVANQLLTQGFYLSFGNAILENVSLQTILSEVPQEQFFLETDAAQININKIYQKAAEIREISLEEMNHQIIKNLDKIRNG